jgi:hypothetical protein
MFLSVARVAATLALLDRAAAAAAMAMLGCQMHRMASQMFRWLARAVVQAEARALAASVVALAAVAAAVV